MSDAFEPAAADRIRPPASTGRSGHGAIVLARHGEPALSRKIKLDARAYDRWWAAYEAGGILPGQVPPSELVLLPRTGVDLCQMSFVGGEGGGGRLPWLDQSDGPAVTDLRGGPYPSGASMIVCAGEDKLLVEARGEESAKTLKESGSPLFVLCTGGRDTGDAGARVLP